jgi:hypothetical protein
MHSSETKMDTQVMYIVSGMEAGSPIARTRGSVAEAVDEARLMAEQGVKEITIRRRLADNERVKAPLPRYDWKLLLGMSQKFAANQSEAPNAAHGDRE